MSNRKTNRIASTDKILCAPKDNRMVFSYTWNVLLKFIKVTVACTAGMLVCVYPIKMLFSSFNSDYVFAVLAILFYFVAFHVADRPFKYIYKVCDRVYPYRKPSWIDVLLPQRYLYRGGLDGRYGFWVVICAMVLCFGIMNVANSDSQVTNDSTYVPLLLLCVTVFFLCLVFFDAYNVFYKWKKRFPRSTVKI